MGNHWFVPFRIAHTVYIYILDDHLQFFHGLGILGTYQKKRTSGMEDFPVGLAIGGFYTATCQVGSACRTDSAAVYGGSGYGTTCAFKQPKL